MNVLKIVSLLTFLTALTLANEATASQQGSKIPPLNEEDRDPSVPQKVGRETARIIGQVEDAGHSISHGFKKQRHKDIAKKKDKK